MQVVELDGNFLVTSPLLVVVITVNNGGLNKVFVLQVQISVAGFEVFVIQPYCLGRVVAEYLKIMHVELMGGDDGHGAVLA
jgi:hypothetical protein